MIQCDKCFTYFYTKHDLCYHRYLEQQKEYEWYRYYFKLDRMSLPQSQRRIMIPRRPIVIK
jgi:hypothetical protein